MMINGATEIATIALRHEFGELCPTKCADETRAKEKKDRCDRDLSPGICCSELIDSWAVSAALASAFGVLWRGCLSKIAADWWQNAQRFALAIAVLTPEQR